MSSEHADAEGLAEVVPDDFTDYYPGDTIAECLEYAHRQAPTSTPSDEVKRCPTCGTQRVYPRGTDASTGPPREHEEAYICTNRHRFEDPVYGDPEDLDLREEEEPDSEGDEADTDGEDTDGEDTDGDDQEDKMEDTKPDTHTDDEEPDPDDQEDTEDPVARRLGTLDDDTLAAIAIYCYRPWNHTDADPTYQEIAGRLPYSRQWVGERVREWKDGGHRQKVPDPRPRFGGGRE
jgi:hypothetical protein